LAIKRMPDQIVLNEKVPEGKLSHEAQPKSRKKATHDHKAPDGTQLTK
jgi:hypothetical protein